MAKQVTIKIETNSLVVVNARGSGLMWCPRCGTESELMKLGPHKAHGDAGWEALQQLIASGDVHRQQAPDGSALICLNSLLAFLHGRFQSRGHSLRAINAKVEEI